MRNTGNYDILEIRDYYPSLNNPSSSTWVYNQVDSLQEMSFNPLVISPTPINPFKKIFKKKYRLYDTPSKKIETYENTHVIRPPYIKIPNNKLVEITLKSLRKCILKNGYFPGIQLIHAHFGQNGFASLSLREKLKVPLVTSFYGYDSGRLAELYKPYYRELIEKGELFLALSQDMKEDLLRIGFPDKKVRVHRLGIDLSSFHPKSTINNEKFTILTVARLDKVKGIQHVMDAIACIIRQYPQLRDKLRYKVIGGGGYELYLKKYAEKIGLSDIVVFKNNLIVSNSREIVLKEMQNCDVFCLCSYTPKNRAKEGTPVVLMEVQACGKPCISTYHAGIPEVVINNKTGILVKEKSVKDIVSAIEMFYFDPRYRLKMGINARRHIQEEFNHSIQMSKLTELYDNIYFNQK